MINVIFGAGETGKRALSKYGKKNVVFFVDNDTAKSGSFIFGIPVRYFKDCIEDLRTAHIIIACKAWKTIEKQLLSFNLRNYEIYGNSGYIDIPELVLNPYVEERPVNKKWLREEINRQVKEIEPDAMFDHVEIETINRCNGVCSFCPVNRNNDVRVYRRMDDSVFEKIIDELAEMNYRGRIALFSNNEPLLDDRIVKFHEMTRKKLPNARMHLCTNGTLLSLDIFTALMENLDELIIDNYNQELLLIPNAKIIFDYCENHADLKSKVTIVLRKPNEILTSRGGDSPNKVREKSEADVSCLLPYKQLIIRPDGKVSLCCNDALGKCTLGDVSLNSLSEIWNGREFRNIRKKMREGRINIPRCRYCDTLFLC
ncbi:radical SAM additional 4Fe4S-binding SPASM domain-containing protein [Lachnospiraceae bacterium]|nr:radical SAM additional 4Fe4S-binding SPASM domain-containing protein [Lachnospiraceae bacterium]